MIKPRLAVAGAFLTLLTLLSAPFLTGHVPAAAMATAELEIPIQVSPSTILLNWKAKGDVKVTVHADVNFSLFDPGSFDITLVSSDGSSIPVSAYYIKADARGDLVAKFPFKEVAAMLSSGTATLFLSAVGQDGNTYVGEDDVRVVGD